MPLAPNQVVEASINDVGKRILKVFCIDSSFTRKPKAEDNFRVKADAIKRNVEKYVGKPFLLTPNNQHPPWKQVIKNWFDDPKKIIAKMLEFQKRYSIGNIFKIEPFALAEGSYDSGANFCAYVELTDQKAIEAFDKGNIPRYVSPSLFRLNPNDESDEISDFEPLHILATDKPAFGFDKAYIHGSATCNSEDSNQCVHLLKEASIEEYDNNYCNCKVGELLSGFQNKYDSSFVDNLIKQASNSMSENKTDSAAPQNTSPQNVSASQPQQSQTNVNELPINKSAVSPVVKTDTIPIKDNNEVSELKQQIATLQSEVNEGKKFREAIEKEKIALDEKWRKEIVEQYVRPEYFQKFGGEAEKKRKDEIDKLLTIGVKISETELVDILKGMYPQPQMDITKPILTTTGKHRVKEGSSLSQFANDNLVLTPPNQDLSNIHGTKAIDLVFSFTGKGRKNN